MLCGHSCCRYRKKLPKPEPTQLELLQKEFSTSYLAMCDYILQEFDLYQVSAPINGEKKNTRAWKPLLDCIYQGLPLHQILLDSFIDSLKHGSSIEVEEEEEEDEEEGEGEDEEEEEEEEEEEVEEEEEEDDPSWKSFLEERCSES